MKISFSKVNLFILLSSILLFIIGFTIDSILNNSLLKEDKIFSVNRGDSISTIFSNLKKESIINNRDINYILYRLLHNNKNIGYGEYLFTKDDKVKDVIYKLINSISYKRKITIVEGLYSKEVIDLINANPYLSGTIKNPHLIKEGDLLPETYLFERGYDRNLLIENMKKDMADLIDELWPKRDKTIPIKSKKEAIILASIIEGEADKDGERSLISSVFINRLRIGMKLQSDPTIIYSFTLGDVSLKRPIRKSDIRNKSKFNTYHIYGLPESPISNPGKSSIKAALNPDKSDYLYFVATGYGGHNFSTNIMQHNKYVREYRKIIKGNNSISTN